MLAWGGGWWRGPTGFWYLLLSGGQSSYANAVAIEWGRASVGDQPMVGDYDGDNRTHLGVWRGPTGFWYLKTSSTNFDDWGSVECGTARLEDIPVPR